MNVIPFPAARAAARAFSFQERLDLRLSAPAAFAVTPRIDEPLDFSALAGMLRGARMALLERGVRSVLSFNVAHAGGEASATFLEDAALEAGATRRAIVFEIEETTMLRGGATLAEGLKERGWFLALRGLARPELPFGSHVRELFDELIMDAPDRLHAFTGVEGVDRSRLGSRLIAARAAGLILTAERVEKREQARELTLLGFDRAAGPFLGEPPAALGAH